MIQIADLQSFLIKFPSSPLVSNSGVGGSQVQIPGGVPSPGGSQFQGGPNSQFRGGPNSQFQGGSQVPILGGSQVPIPGGSQVPILGGSKFRGGPMSGGGSPKPCDLSQHAFLILPVCCPNCN